LVAVVSGNGTGSGSGGGPGNGSGTGTGNGNVCTIGFAIVRKVIAVVGAVHASWKNLPTDIPNQSGRSVAKSHGHIKTKNMVFHTVTEI